MTGRPFILGTRGSTLALWQAHRVRDALEAHGYAVTVQTVTTTGDRILDTPLAEIGDKGLFTKELDVALLEGAIQLAVHSLKDLPTRLPDGIALAAVSERADPSDAFVAHPSFEGQLQDLPPGAVLATASLRRRAQLKAWRSDLEIIPVRGNVDTRIRKLDDSDWHGLILAVAGLQRLGLEHRIRQRIPLDIMLPAVGQGALGVVCAERDQATQDAVREAIHHPPTARATAAERAFLRRLEGGCQVPIGTYTHYQDQALHLEGCVASLDGTRLLRGQRVGPPADAEQIGTDLAEDLLKQGADEILEAIRNAET